MYLGMLPWSVRAAMNRGFAFYWLGLVSTKGILLKVGDGERIAADSGKQVRNGYLSRLMDEPNLA